MKKIREESCGLAVQVNSLQNKGTSLESRDTHDILSVKLCGKSHKATHKGRQAYKAVTFTFYLTIFLYTLFNKIFIYFYFI